MTRSIAKVVLLALLVTGGWIGYVEFDRKHTANANLEEMQHRLMEERAKSELLKQVVQHLQTETRVAEIVVTKTETVNGQLKSTLYFQETGKDGGELPPKQFVINGNEAHIDALVVKFEGKFVEGRDPLRGHSLALFTRLFDSTQAPDKGFVIDDPGHIPAVYKGADPRVSAFEQQLWQDFWKLAEDPSYRHKMGVEVLQGKSVWWRFEPGYRYVLTLQNDADLNLRYEPLKGIYRALIKSEQAQQP